MSLTSSTVVRYPTPPTPPTLHAALPHEPPTLPSQAIPVSALANRHCIQLAHLVRAPGWCRRRHSRKPRRNSAFEEHAAAREYSDHHATVQILSRASLQVLALSLSACAVPLITVCSASHFIGAGCIIGGIALVIWQVIHCSLYRTHTTTLAHRC